MKDRRLIAILAAMTFGLLASACGSTWEGLKQDTSENVQATGEVIEDAGEGIQDAAQ